MSLLADIYVFRVISFTTRAAKLNRKKKKKKRNKVIPDGGFSRRFRRRFRRNSEVILNAGTALFRIVYSQCPVTENRNRPGRRNVELGGGKKKKIATDSVWASPANGLDNTNRCDRTERSKVTADGDRACVINRHYGRRPVSPLERKAIFSRQIQRRTYSRRIIIQWRGRARKAFPAAVPT